jgi:broad specificity phosphatase PhoE
MPTVPAPFDPATERILPSARVCRIHLFRHAEVVGAGERLCRGHIDVPLSAHGEQQTRSTASRWHGPYDRVYTSDLQRCTALAKELQGHAPLRSTARLREQNMGDWEGISWAELTQRDPAGTSAYWGDYVNARPPGGESFGELCVRVTDWWSEENPEGNIAIVTHIGCIRALVCSWLGLGAGEGLRFAPEYASHSELLLAEAGVVIVKFGETPQ